ncbi:MAG: hypothetical protein PHI31_17885, partial [Desulfuromonadaceae bacterium]|nr:hypothetical protein [Desulfuromonadaceae bacterium]
MTKPKIKTKAPVKIKRKYHRHKQLQICSSMDSMASVKAIRLGVFSGYHGPLTTKLGENTITFDCSGQDQEHNDILDYMMSHCVESFLDTTGNLYLGAVLTDYFRWKKIKPDVGTFKKKVKELQKLRIEVKNIQCDVSSPVVGLSGYLNRSAENGTDVQIKKLRRGEVFFIQIMPLFLKFLDLDVTLKYPDLIPNILGIKSDTVKSCVRYFLTQTYKEGWLVKSSNKTGYCSTRVLCSRLYPDHMLVSKDKRNRRERDLRDHAGILKDSFGIIFDAVADTWTYTRHPQLRYKMSIGPE